MRFPSSVAAPCAGSSCGCLTHETVLSITEMCCPTEERMIRAKLGGLPGVHGLNFDLGSRTVTVTHVPEALPRSLSAIRALGFDPIQRAQALPARERPAGRWWLMIVAGLAALLAEFMHGGTGWFRWGGVVLAVGAILTVGLPTYRKGWSALAAGSLTINALMTIAVTGALLIGEWPEAAMVLVLFAVAERLEAGALERSRRAIRDLLALAPSTATVRGASGTWQQVDAGTVVPGMVVRALPGARIALDGVVLEGASTVDQSPITGESVPIDVTIGDQVYAGTLNGDSVIEYRVAAAATDTTLARVLRSIESAQQSRAPIQRFVDRFASIYTPAVLVVAAVVAFMPPLLLGAAWGDWIYRSLVLLVIACPCALVISTPIAIVSGLSAAARRGILIKGGKFLEIGHRLRWLGIDKTGTLTSGQLRVVDVVLARHADAERALAAAASLAALSDHPASIAIARYGALDTDVARVTDHRAEPGRGVTGMIEGRRYYLGSDRWLATLGIARPDGDTTQPVSTWLADDEGVRVGFVLSDTVKSTSRAAVDQLRSLGIETVILSGDHQARVDDVARQVGIDTGIGGLLPQDKLSEIEGLMARGGVVAMAGDGINDAPALARADIGFAMGAAGTATALETAAVAIADDDLSKIPTFVRVARATRRVIHQNIVLALGIKLVFLGTVVLGAGTMWMAVVADLGTSLLVIANSLRLVRR